MRTSDKALFIIKLRPGAQGARRATCAHPNTKLGCAPAEGGQRIPSPRRDMPRLARWTGIPRARFRHKTIRIREALADARQSPARATSAKVGQGKAHLDSESRCAAKPMRTAEGGASPIRSGMRRAEDRPVTPAARQVAIVH